MPISFVQRIRKIAEEVESVSDKINSLMEIKKNCNIKVHEKSSPQEVKILLESLKKIPSALVRECGIKVMGFQDMGESKEYYPNHGKYKDGTLILNSRLLDDDRLITDKNSNKTISKFEQTLFHELGHGFDDDGGSKDSMSLKPEWMGLSGWSKEPKPGLRRVRIREKGSPEVVGEYYYSPDAGFTRFYAKRNPWDDFADSFSYYVAGLESYLPAGKIKYLDEKLEKFFKGKKNVS